jgi:hypothetical protein
MKKTTATRSTTRNHTAIAATIAGSFWCASTIYVVALASACTVTGRPSVQTVKEQAPMTNSGLSDALQALITRWRQEAEKYASIAMQLRANRIADWKCYQVEALAVKVCAAELAAICTRVTASPQPEAEVCRRVQRATCREQWPHSAGAWCDICGRNEVITEIKQAIDEKLLVYGDGLIDKGALYREVLNDESRSPDGDGLGRTRPNTAVESGYAAHSHTAGAAEPSGQTTAAKAERKSPKAGAGSEPADSHTIAREEPSAVAESCGIVEQEPDRP